MSDLNMMDLETPDKYIYDTIEELIETENQGLVLKILAIKCHKI